MGTSAEKDLERAQDLREMGKKAKGQRARAQFEKAASRLEERAAKKAGKLGRRARRRAGGTTPIGIR